MRAFLLPLNRNATVDKMQSFESWISSFQFGSQGVRETEGTMKSRNLVTVSTYLLFCLFYDFRHKPGRTANASGVFRCVGSFITTTQRRRELKCTERA